MIKFVLVVLAGASISLIAYPFWSVFSPDSFRLELAEHYAYHPGASSTEVVRASGGRNDKIYFTLLARNISAIKYVEI